MADIRGGISTPETQRWLIDTVRRLEGEIADLRGMEGRRHNDPPKTPWYTKNTSGVSIPAYACLQVVGTVYETDRTYLHVQQPADEIGEAGWYVFNGPEEIAIGGYGVCQVGPHVRALGPTSSAGDRYSPTEDQWTLQKKDGGPFIAAGPDLLRPGTNVQRMFIGGNGGETTRFTGYLAECLVKCLPYAEVTVFNPETASGTGGFDACGDGNGPRYLMLHNGSAGPADINFGGFPYVNVVMYNRWHLDAPAGTAVIFEKVQSVNGNYEWQIVQVEDHFARTICGTYSDGEITEVDVAADGINPLSTTCGSIDLVDCLGAVCDMEKVVAVYCPELSTQAVQKYLLVASKSALLGTPEIINAVDFGDSPGNGPQLEADGCGFDLTLPGVAFYAFPCDLPAPADKTLEFEPALVARTVLTGAQADVDWTFTRDVVYVCNYGTAPNLVIEGTDCVSESGSS